jgi:hypothetical protein
MAFEAHCSPPYRFGALRKDKERALAVESDNDAFLWFLIVE